MEGGFGRYIKGERVKISLNIRTRFNLSLRDVVEITHSKNFT